MEIQAYMAEARRVTDARLKELLPAETAYPEVIHQAMAYSVVCRRQTVSAHAVSGGLRGRLRLLGSLRWTQPVPWNAFIPIR